MAQNKKATNSGIGEDIEVAISKTEAFIEKNQKRLIYAVLAIVVIVSGFIFTNKLYFVPQEVEAQNQMAKSQNYFATDSFKLALNGNGLDSKGFKRIIENYGFTKSANLAKAYAGICLYKMGDYKQAISYLEEFDGNESVNVSPVIIGLIGDAYVELSQTDKALTYYAQAYESKNKVLSPVFLKKAAAVYQSKGNYDKAIELYKIIKDEYFDSSEAIDIDKFIEKANITKK